jgi:2-methylisocitrate lyase-like PEP mutase family enzyme
LSDGEKMKKTTAMRSILTASEMTMSVSAHDALLARLVERAGFKMIAISGNTVAASHLGMPDMGFLNLTDMVDVARRIAAAVDIPVMVDADTGYGNAMQVMRTVREFEQAGVAGIFIEDQIDYKKCRMMEAGHPVVPAEDHAAKIRAACRARTDPDFVIAARTDAAADHGIDEAIRRGHLYAEAGADMLDIEVLGTPEEVEQIARARFAVPLKANMDEGKRLWLNEFSTLESAGYKVAAYPGTLRYIVVRAATEALAHLARERSTAGLRDKMATVREYFDALDQDRYLALEKELLQPFTAQDQKNTDPRAN